VDAKVLEMLKKYSKGDFGTAVFADLDYSIKRIISGLSSENSEVKEGYFLVLVLLFKNFWVLFDKSKLINYIVEETKNSKALKKSEKTHFSVGRLLCFNSVIEAMPVESEGEEWIELLAKELLSVYNHNEGLRQGVISVALKAMKVKLIENGLNVFLNTFGAQILNEKNQTTSLYLSIHNFTLYLALVQGVEGKEVADKLRDFLSTSFIEK